MVTIAKLRARKSRIEQPGYGWVITADVLDGPESREVGMLGPRGLKFSKDEIISKGKKFEMFDDDGELYYEGYLLGGTGLEPLDDFGMPNAGCTEIKINGESV